MAAPFQRICCRTAKQASSQSAHPRPHLDVRQWQSLRSFSAMPHAAARPTGDSNRFRAPFPAPDDSKIDPAYEEDDISSLGYAELDQHRELRDMVRIAAWEMPLLFPLRKHFTPPLKERLPLRWRHTTYMGETHPAAHKVVVDFKPADLPDLSPEQREKLLKLAGTRYNYITGLVRMSCESFETQAQNKRYLGTTIQNLLAEAKDPSADTFADIPLDTRHVKQKPRHRFPTEWLLTEERKAELEERRRQSLLSEGQRVEESKMVSGFAAIEAARQVEAEKVKEPEMVQARQPVAKAKVGRKEMEQQRRAQR